MKTYHATQDWMPPVSKVPVRVQKALLPFRPTVKGWTIWYQGRTRTVCGITVDLADVLARWAKLRATIDAEAASACKRRSKCAAGGGKTGQSRSPKLPS